MDASPGLDEGVDTHLKVLGVDGLRVVDASVKLVLIGGNINAAVIMTKSASQDDPAEVGLLTQVMQVTAR
jgi:hypothetical protein